MWCIIKHSRRGTRVSRVNPKGLGRRQPALAMRQHRGEPPSSPKPLRARRNA